MQRTPGELTCGALLGLTGQQHVNLSLVRAQVDGGRGEVEGGGVLLHGQVHQAEVVQHLPVERRQVVGALQAADGLEREGVETIEGTV